MENIGISEETKRKFIGLIADKFNIVLEESRLEDYEFKSFNPKKSTIEILDKKTGAVYSSKIDREADILDFHDCSAKYSNWKMVSPRYKLEKLFHLASKNPVISYKSPVIERLTFSEGEYDLIFEKQKPYHIETYRNHGLALNIRYVKRIECDGQVYSTDLLSRTYVEHLIGEDKGNFEELCACAPSEEIPCDSSLEEKTDVVKDSVVYTFNESVYPSLESNNHDMIGVCFENAKVDVRKYLPSNFQTHNGLLTNESTISGIVINGGLGNNHHSLEIYKTPDCIRVRYGVHDLDSFEGMCREFNISNRNLDTICTSEIAEVIGALTALYDDDEFIRLAITKLENFSERINVRRGHLREVCDALDPKLFLYRTMGEIATVVLANKDAYFDLARRDFEKATTVNDSGAIGFQKTLIGPENK